MLPRPRRAPVCADFSKSIAERTISLINVPSQAQNEGYRVSCGKTPTRKDTLLHTEFPSTYFIIKKYDLRRWKIYQHGEYHQGSGKYLIVIF
jgi:hypothetical protein